MNARWPTHAVPGASRGLTEAERRSWPSSSAAPRPQQARARSADQAPTKGEVIAAIVFIVWLCAVVVLCKSQRERWRNLGVALGGVGALVCLNAMLHIV
jgi:hypothetical protein